MLLQGRLPILVTSRVLNEGVDIPAAEIAVVLSGTGTVREHVQRLGRLTTNEREVSYFIKLVAQDTAEEILQRRRRMMLTSDLLDVKIKEEIAPKFLSTRSKATLRSDPPFRFTSLGRTRGEIAALQNASALEVKHNY